MRRRGTQWRRTRLHRTRRSGTRSGGTRGGGTSGGSGTAAEAAAPAAAQRHSSSTRGSRRGSGRCGGSRRCGGMRSISTRGISASSGTHGGTSGSRSGANARGINMRWNGRERQREGRESRRAWEVGHRGPVPRGGHGSRGGARLNGRENRGGQARNRCWSPDRRGDSSRNKPRRKGREGIQDITGGARGRGATSGCGNIRGWTIPSSSQELRLTNCVLITQHRPGRGCLIFTDAGIYRCCYVVGEYNIPSMVQV